jgi:hypothetical protein
VVEVQSGVLRAWQGYLGPDPKYPWCSGRAVQFKRRAAPLLYVEVDGAGRSGANAKGWQSGWHTTGLLGPRDCSRTGSANVPPDRRQQVPI